MRLTGNFDMCNFKPCVNTITTTQIEA